METSQVPSTLKFKQGLVLIYYQMRIFQSRGLRSSFVIRALHCLKNTIFTSSHSKFYELKGRKMKKKTDLYSSLISWRYIFFLVSFHRHKSDRYVGIWFFIHIFIESEWIVKWNEFWIFVFFFCFLFSMSKCNKMYI